MIKVADNSKNLISLADRTPEERRAIAQKGGRACAEKRKEEKKMRDMLRALLDTRSKKDNKTYAELATLGLIKGAIKGNAQNYRTILEVLGELNAVQDDAKMQGLAKVQELLGKLEDEAKK